MDPKEKQELMDSLKQGSYKISKKVEAEKDDFRIVISSQGIEQYYKNMPIITIKAENLSQKALELINKNPEIAATTLLEQFANEFDVTGFEKKAASGMDIKTAANETLDEMTWQMITQKQFDDQKPKLHPRTDEYPNTVTQKQLPEAGLRPGTYEVTTQGQLRDERTTFYGAPRTAGDWKTEDRNIVTEGQLDKGASEYSELGTSDRDTMAAKFDGGPKQQHKMTGEKQLAELLKHHKWTEPLTTTEGKDQLGQQDGELSRLTAEVANKIVKEALDALGKTVLSVGVTPNNLAAVMSQLVSHESKYPVLANVIRSYAGSDTSAIERKVAKARHFGKVANVGTDWSDELIADVAVRQFAKMSYNPRFIVEALAALAESPDFESRINAATDDALANSSDVKTAEDTNKSVFKQVLSGETKPTVTGDDSDGMYAYHGVIAEVNADVKDEKAFAKEAAAFAKKQILANTGKEINLVEKDILINEKEGTFSIHLKDAAKDNTELEARAAARRQLAKKASTKEAQMGGMGGMAPPAGDQMGNPAPPPGAADMGAPPAGESLTQEPPLPEEEEAGGGEPKPPGTVCAVCGSEDVDIDNGAIRCNNCGAEGTISVHMQWDKWPGTIEDTEEKGKGGFGLGDEAEAGMGGEDEQEAAAAEGGATMPNVPVGASVRITPFMLEKLSAQNIKLGQVCPNCGSKETNSVKSQSKGNDSVCWECGTSYRTVLKAVKGKKNSLFAETVWVPKSASATNCSSCTRLHKAFKRSLKDYGMSWDQFDKLAMKDQAAVIVKMSNSNTLNIKDAMEAPLPLEKFAASPRWTGSDKFDKFPSASCRERLSRRFGENATAMSGPCQGQKLADCVCGQLETLGIYSDGLAAKVASAQASIDPMLNNPVETCVKMLANDGFSLKDACVACDGLRAAYASLDDLVIETIAQISPASKFTAPKPKPMKPAPMPGAAPSVGAPGGAKAMPGAPAPQAAPMESPGQKTPGTGAAKGLDDPQDEPVTDDLVDDLGGDMGMDDGFEGMEIEMEAPSGLGGMEGGQPDTVSLLMDIAEDFSQLAKALAGDIDESMIEPEGEFGEEGEDEDEEGESLDDSLDVSDVTEDVVDGGEEPEGFGGDAEEAKEHDDSDLPPGVGESDDGGLEKDSNPSESKDCGAPCSGKKKRAEAPSDSFPKDKPSKPLAAETKPQMIKEASAEKETTPEQKELDNLLFGMKRGTIKKSSEALDSIFDGLLKIAAKAKNDVKKVEYKSADEGSKVKVKPAQDAEGIGTVSKGGKIGHEEPFSKGVKTKPDVPRSKALMGEEGTELTVDETKDMPTVPRGAANLEGEEIYKSDQSNNVDGNQGGQKVASGCKCKCGDPKCNCDCGSKSCGKPCGGGPKGKPCSAGSKKTTKTAAPVDLGTEPSVGSDIDPVTSITGAEPEPEPDPEAFEPDTSPVDDSGDPGFNALMERFVAATKKADPELDDTDIMNIATSVFPKQTDQIESFFHARGVPTGMGKLSPEPAQDIFDMTDTQPDYDSGSLVAAKTKGKSMKTAKFVNPQHKLYATLVEKVANGQSAVKLTDGKIYDLAIDQKKNVILTPKISKESQTVSPKSVGKLEDDPDINQSSGPGKGKVKEDKTHSLAVDEKKPSEGMREPSVPEAPNGGRLVREHTVEKAKNGPEIPAGGGSNPEYDTVEKYAPEKLDETLGKDNGLGAVAENHELAVKIAGKLLKANKISVDDLPKTIDELSKKTVAEILDTFEGAMKVAETKEGIQKTASVDAVESLPPIVTNMTNKAESGKPDLVSNIKSLFTLDKRNEDYQRYSQDKEAKLWR